LLGDGASGSHTKVRFRMLVFRPQMEEVLTVKIKSCSKEGVHVSLEFLDDILIPAERLQHPSRFDETESVCVWKYPVEEGEHHDLFMDPGEKIRIRVVSEQFVDTGPTKPKITESEQKTPPYSLVGTINEPGLGLLSWRNS
jgi:DNA-directed RNA polymerase III subunit RPC8